MAIKGNILPLPERIFVTDMEFGDVMTASGVWVPSDDRKSVGIHPRWGKVWKVGKGVDKVKVGDWVLVDHGRWSRGLEYENDDGTKLVFRRVENKSILLTSPN